MLKSKKIREIRSEPELLRINSRYKKMTDFSKKLFIAFILILFIAYLSICMVFLKEKGGSEQIAFISLTAILLAIALFVFYTTNRRKGSPLIITEKGVFAEPGIAEFWEDIESYAWEEYMGALNKTDFSANDYRISLLIYTKNFWNTNIEAKAPRTLSFRDHSMLSQYGVFFTPDEVEETNKIFQSFGIKRHKDYNLS